MIYKDLTETPETPEPIRVAVTNECSVDHRHGPAAGVVAGYHYCGVCLRSVNQMLEVDAR